MSFTIHYFIFHFKCYSSLHFAVCQLLCWAFLYDVVTNRPSAYVVHARRDERAGRWSVNDTGSSHMLSWLPLVDEFLESHAGFGDASCEPDVARRRKSRTGCRSPTGVANRMSYADGSREPDVVRRRNSPTGCSSPTKVAK